MAISVTLQDVKEARKLLEKATCTIVDAMGNKHKYQMPVGIYGSNNFNIVVDDHDGSFIWDDANERIILFLYASQPDLNIPAPAMSAGKRPMTPVYVSFMPYNEIISLRAVLTLEAFNNLCDAIGTSLMPANIREKVYNKFFRDTDMHNIIARKQDTNYVSQNYKWFDQAKHSYDDQDEYDRTVRPQHVRPRPL